MRDGEIVNVTFYNDVIQCVEHEGHPFVPVRPIVENLGLSWKPQYTKLMSNQKLWGVSRMTTPSAGGPQETVCIPVEKIFAFLLSIHASKVREDLRGKLLTYQEECHQVLWDYWTSESEFAPHRTLPADDEEDAVFDRRIGTATYDYWSPDLFVYRNRLVITTKGIASACRKRLWKHVDIISLVQDMVWDYNNFMRKFKKKRRSRFTITTGEVEPLRVYEVGSVLEGTVPYYALELSAMEELFIRAKRFKKGSFEENPDFFRCVTAFLYARSVFSGDNDSFSLHEQRKKMKSMHPDMYMKRLSEPEPEPEVRPQRSSDDVYKDQTFDMSF